MYFDLIAYIYEVYIWQIVNYRAAVDSKTNTTRINTEKSLIGLLCNRKTIVYYIYQRLDLGPSAISNYFILASVG
jgi:hypothetical protein